MSSTLLERYYRIARQAIKDAHEMLPKGSFNIDNPLPQAEQCIATMKNWQRVALANVEGEPWVYQVAQRAALRKCGNCGELAALVYVLLKEQPVRPLEYARLVWSAESGLPEYNTDHDFVMIGRHPSYPQTGLVVDAHGWRKYAGGKNLPLEERVYPRAKMALNMCGRASINFVPRASDPPELMMGRMPT